MNDFKLYEIELTTPTETVYVACTLDEREVLSRYLSMIDSVLNKHGISIKVDNS